VLRRWFHLRATVRTPWNEPKSETFVWLAPYLSLRCSVFITRQLARNGSNVRNSTNAIAKPAASTLAML
jgi:hypothetical protein